MAAHNFIQFLSAVPARGRARWQHTRPSADKSSALWEHQGDKTCENKRSPHQGKCTFEKTERKHTEENPIPRACGSLLRLLLPVAHLHHLRFFLAVLPTWVRSLGPPGCTHLSSASRSVILKSSSTVQGKRHEFEYICFGYWKFMFQRVSPSLASRAKV